MKRMRFESGIGNGSVVVPSGQIHDISMAPGVAGSWVQINNSKAIWVPGTASFELGYHELGGCCGQKPCDMFPGDQQIEIVFGTEVQLPEGVSVGSEPLAWFVVWNGC